MRFDTRRGTPAGILCDMVSGSVKLFAETGKMHRKVVNKV